jgi:hypothetical protein
MLKGGGENVFVRLRWPQTDGQTALPPLPLPNLLRFSPQPRQRC